MNGRRVDFQTEYTKGMYLAFKIKFVVFILRGEQQIVSIDFIFSTGAFFVWTEV